MKIIGDLRDIVISEIYKGGRRALNAAVVDDLAKSIGVIGLMNPITVRDYDGEGPYYWHLVAGAHRLAAHENLAKTTIRAQVIDGSEPEARLWEIEENLLRAELTVMERAALIVERDALLAAQRKTPKPEEPKRKPGRPAGAKNKPKNIGGVSTQVAKKPPNKGGRRKTSSETADSLGITHDDVTRAAKIERLDYGAKEEAKRLGLDDNQSALLEAAKGRSPSEQIESLRRHAVKKERVKPDREEIDVQLMARQQVAKLAKQLTAGQLQDYLDEFTEQIVGIIKQRSAA